MYAATNEQYKFYNIPFRVALISLEKRTPIKCWLFDPYMKKRNNGRCSLTEGMESTQFTSAHSQYSVLYGSDNYISRC